ncbi:MAG: carbohydrate ABC transporter permease [Eubacteriales bacterium]|nr:carbohydrate ABC transporter permease [Eubacteriales bacterium]
MKRITVSKTMQVILCLLILFLIVFPFAWLLVSTFKLQKDIIKWPPTFWPKHWTFKNYSAVFERIPLAKYILNTVIFAGFVSLFSSFFDSVAGYAFARLDFKGKNVIFNIVLLTMLVPFQIVMIPLYIELNLMGILNTFVGLILPRITSAYGIFFMRSFFTGLPKELQEAARIDGMGEFGIFAKIMLPLCKPAFITFFIFCLTSNWNDLIYPLMMTSSTAMRTLPAGLAIFVGEGVRETGPALAGALISMLPLLILYCAAQKYFVEGIAVSGMKG